MKKTITFICLTIILSFAVFAASSCDDDFTGTTINSNLWNTFADSNYQVSQDDELIVEHTSTNVGSGGVTTITAAKLTGNFDVQVDFTNDRGTGISEAILYAGTDSDHYFEIVDRYDDEGSHSMVRKFKDGDTFSSSAVTCPTGTKLRLTRVPDGAKYKITGYTWSGGSWNPCTGAYSFSSNDDVEIKLYLNVYSTTGTDQRVTFDNYQVNSGCQLICGNSVTEGNEACDDGNTADDCICLSDCTDPFCGDGQICGAEQCDPPGIGCSDSCQLENGSGVIPEFSDYGIIAAVVVIGIGMFYIRKKHNK